MRSVIDIARDHVGHAVDVKAKERGGEAVPTFDVWAREPGKSRGRRALVIRFPTLHMDAPEIERV